MGTSNNTFSTVVELRNISKVYGFTNALKNISLTIKEGETIGLIGNNGAGKSTLLKIISQLVKPTHGEMILFGKKLGENIHLVKQEFGILLNQSFFYEDMSGRENLEFFLRVNNKITDPDPVITKAVSQHHLKLFIDRPTHELSTGMRKKLEILRTVLPDFPKLLLLDEPFSGLDGENRKFLRDLLTNREEKTTVVLCSHNFSAVGELCSRVVYLERGRLTQILTPSEYDFFLDKENNK
ncbi:MAG: ABC transporter ATP-binding protein [Candidatus Heimdallarchaeota archaeon]|nr:ABC transporter ATP-binding protein [Candidatus Heimdallarchaeota archaeon]